MFLGTYDCIKLRETTAIIGTYAGGALTMRLVQSLLTLELHDMVQDGFRWNGGDISYGSYV